MTAAHGRAWPQQPGARSGRGGGALQHRADARARQGDTAAHGDALHTRSAAVSAPASPANRAALPVPGRIWAQLIGLLDYLE